MTSSHTDTDNYSSVQHAVSAIRKGGVIAYPTEAVFGLGCDPRSEAALQRIIEIKGRDAHKGFILIAARQAQLSEFLTPINAKHQRQLDEHWPGPVTFVAPVSKQFNNSLLTGYRSSLAVRVSDHPTVIELCNQYDGAIVSTSANRSGDNTLRTAKDVAQVFGCDLDAIVDFPIGKLSSPTRIFELASGRQLR